MISNESNSTTNDSNVLLYSDDDIDEWVTKTKLVQQAINSIINNDDDKYDSDNNLFLLSSNECGNEEQQQQEEKRKQKVRQELAEKILRERLEEKKREKEKWWEGAIYLHGDINNSPTTPLIPYNGHGEDDDDAGINVVQSSTTGYNKINIVNDNDDEKKQKEEQQKRVLNRYSCDYSRWTDSDNYKNDPATKEETEELLKQKERMDHQRFEDMNKEWCESMKREMDERDAKREKKQLNATQLKNKGNQFFKKKMYEKALEKYREAMALSPYNVQILTNIALCHGKRNEWEDSIEFCKRVLHVKPCTVKALFIRSMAFEQSGQLENARRDLEAALKLEPENEEVVTKLSVIYNSLKDAESENQVLSFLDKKAKLLHFKAIDDFSQTIIENYESIDVSTEEYILFMLQSVPDLKTYVRVKGLLELVCRKIREILPKTKDGCCDESYPRHLLKFVLVSIQGQVKSKDILVKEKLLHVLLDYSLIQNGQFYEHFLLFTEIIEDVDEQRLNAYTSDFNIEACFIFMKHVVMTGDLYDGEHDDPNLFFVVAQAMTRFLLSVMKGKKSRKRMIELFLHQEQSSRFNVISFMMDLLKSTSTGIVVCSAHKRKHFVQNTKLLLLDCLLLFSGLLPLRKLFIADTTWSLDTFATTFAFDILAMTTSNSSKMDTQCESCLKVLSNITCPITCSMEEEAMRMDTSFDIKQAALFQRELLSTVTSATLSPLLTLFTSECLENYSYNMKIAAAILLVRISTNHHFSVSLKEDCQLSMKLLSELNSILSCSDIKILGGESPEMMGKYASLLIHLVALTESPHVSEHFVLLFVDIIMQIMPAPQCEDISSKKVTASSVCLPPKKHSDGSIVHILSQTQSCHGNLMKIFIQVMDSKTTALETIESKPLIDSLVCFIANYNSYPKVAVKNAASILARLVKANDERMEYCRSLRGMEILIELNRKKVI